MAVYTEVTDGELAAFLAAYDVGEPVAFKGIAEGVENSNFLLDTTAGQFVLTIYERRVKAADLPFFLGLTRELAVRGFPAPPPLADRRGSMIGEVRGKPAALIRFLPGISPRAPDAAACYEAGAGLAWLHKAGDGLERRLPRRRNDLGQGAWRALAAPLIPAAERLRPGLAGVLARDIAALEDAWPSDLPPGFIHADFFPDNVLFVAGRFAGAIDFYFAAWDLLAFDLAIAVDAWAFDGGGRPDAAKAAAFIEGYETRRPLASAERAALPILARGAAMRFLLTRLKDWRATPPGALVRPKDPSEYVLKLDLHRAGYVSWPNA